jgi:ADP-ribose pyrophosphatase YjhB (NUDIX family)
VIQISSLLSQITSWEDPSDGEAMKSRELSLLLLRETPDPLSRYQWEPGHITGTACVLNPARTAILLVHHRKLNRWLLPGGHIEDSADENVSDTARREAVEETGVEIRATLPAPLVGLDVHGIPARKKEPYHLHHDLIFGFHAATDALQQSEEVRSVVWCPVQRFDEFALPAPIRRAAQRLLR